MRFVRFVPAVLRLLGGAAILFPKAFILRESGVQAFAKALQQMDIEPEVVRELSGAYKELGNIKNWLKRSKNGNAH
jgi:hypothetical protein